MATEDTFSKTARTVSPSLFPYGKRRSRVHLRDTRIVRPNPVRTDYRSHTQTFRDVFGADHPVATLVERIDTSFLIA